MSVYRLLISVACVGALAGFLITGIANVREDSEISKEILVCSSPLGETIPAGKGYRYIYLEERSGMWCLSDGHHSCEYYQQIPGEICRVEPLDILDKGEQ